jgi:hypothetical protein
VTVSLIHDIYSQNVLQKQRIFPSEK